MVGCLIQASPPSESAMESRGPSKVPCAKIKGYPGEKETQISKPLPKVKNASATQKEDLQGGQKDKIYQMFEKERTPRASI
jgi:hypothetical protein